MEPPKEGVTMEVKKTKKPIRSWKSLKGSGGAGVEEHHGGRGRRQETTEQNSNDQEPSQIRHDFCFETKAGKKFVSTLISCQSKYGERKATVRRRTMRKKDGGGLADQPIKEDDEDSLGNHSVPFAVRRTKSKIDPHGLEDRDV